MIGKKPTNSHIVTREFRGSRLYLHTMNRGARYWRWTDDQRTALRMDHATALDASESASREFGARCAVIDAAGALSKRDAASVEQTFKLFWSPEGKCIATVKAHTMRQAIAKAPKPYSKYLGEIYAEVQL
jgi:hypothetical protein